MTPLVSLIAHFNGTTGVRQKSLRVVAITQQNVMLVLWDNRLQAVHTPIPGLTLDRIEVMDEPKVTYSVAPPAAIVPAPKPKKDKEPKAEETKPTEE